MDDLNCGVKTEHTHERVYCDVCGKEIGQYCDQVHLKGYVRQGGDHEHRPRQAVTVEIER